MGWDGNSAYRLVEANSGDTPYRVHTPSILTDKVEPRRYDLQWCMVPNVTCKSFCRSIALVTPSTNMSSNCN